MTRRAPTAWPRSARVASGWVAFVALLVVVWLGTPAIAPIVLGLGVVGILEYAAMLRLRGLLVHRTTLLAFAVLVLPSALAWGEAGGALRLLAPGREALLLAFALALFVLALRRPHQESLTTVAHTLLGLVWIPLFLSYGLDVRALDVVGHGAALLVVLSIVAADVGGYLAGHRWGRRPMAPRLSPDKSVEGAIGGLVLAAVTAPVAMTIVEARGAVAPLHGAGAVAFGVAVAAAAQLGDLAESLFKRWVGVKDTGLFLPGHGGVLDRIDSHLFGIPAGYLLLRLLGIA
ncbi:MAG: phosphatidate cytidylyltransferase [Trueperaceae bacterium]|nr:phosphatidate cytidylyltransferase [Trueperaceae bacterium]